MGYAAVSVNSVPLWSDTRRLFDTWEKIEGQISALFHQGLDIISPGTHFFLRLEGSQLTSFSLLVVKESVQFSSQLNTHGTYNRLLS
jgi:hypothetical protein